MSKIVVASKNPIKIQAVLDAFERMFPEATFEAEGVSVPSGVKDQPTSDDETYQGAYNRAVNASNTMPGADYYVGLEGGIEDTDGEMCNLAWAVVRDASGKVGKSRTATMYLPAKIAELVRNGKELGDADDIVFGKTNSKQANGATGILTGDVITRSMSYSNTIIFALIPFKNPDLY